jgi:hypothetical protein
VVSVTEPRMVRCRYSRDAHPLDGECVDISIAEVWTDAEVEAGLRRVLAAIGDYPPKPAVHESHRPEEPGVEILPGHTTCKVCCRFVAHHGCASPRGVAPCGGPGRVELREVG